MKALLVAVAVFAVLLALFPPASADVIIPTVTKVYFDNAGTPYDAPINFMVTCYGYSYPPGPGVDKPAGSYVPEDVFGFSADCPRYGCEIQQNYYLNYKHLDWCDLNGTAGGKDFYIRNYSNRPVSGCDFGGGNNGPERSCTLRFSIPPGTVSAPSAKSTPLPTATQQPSAKPTAAPAPQDFLSSIITGVICFLAGLFGGSC